MGHLSHSSPPSFLIIKVAAPSYSSSLFQHPNSPSFETQRIARCTKTNLRLSQFISATLSQYIITVSILNTRKYSMKMPSCLLLNIIRRTRRTAQRMPGYSHRIQMPARFVKKNLLHQYGHIKTVTGHIKKVVFKPHLQASSTWRTIKSNFTLYINSTHIIARKDAFLSFRIYSWKKSGRPRITKKSMTFPPTVSILHTTVGSL